MIQLNNHKKFYEIYKMNKIIKYPDFKIIFINLKKINLQKYPICYLKKHKIKKIFNNQIFKHINETYHLAFQYLNKFLSNCLSHNCLKLI